jgi:hypothetical protein
MSLPEQDTVEILVTVGIPSLETRASEAAWEQDVLSAVSAAVRADATLNTLDVRLLSHEDCTWILEGGVPMPAYNVTVFEDGSWHSGVERFPKAPEASGQDLQSLFEYLVGKGLVKK